MIKKTKVIILHHHKIVDFIVDIERHLNAGFKVVGSMVVIHSEFGHNYYQQMHIEQEDGNG